MSNPGSPEKRAKYGKSRQVGQSQGSKNTAPFQKMDAYGSNDQSIRSGEEGSASFSNTEITALMKTNSTVSDKPKNNGYFRFQQKSSTEEAGRGGPSQLGF